MEIHSKMYKWTVALGAEWRKDYSCRCCTFPLSEYIGKINMLENMKMLV
jgi:hypothetical protein